MATEVTTSRQGLTRPEIAVQGAVAQASAFYGVDPSLVMAHIYAESSFNPNAVRIDTDGKKSYGLGQVREDTAATIAGQPVSLSLLMDPETNVRLTAGIIRMNTAQWGDTPDAVAAYNAGIPRRDASGRYVNSQGIPTVHVYVQRVLSARALYTQGISPMKHPISAIMASAGIPIPVIAIIGVVAWWFLRSVGSTRGGGP